MKVLIIGNDASNLDNAILIVKRKFESATVVHIDNYNEAIKICSTKREIDEFNLIILNMAFCRAKPREGTEPLLHPLAGSMFLAHLAKNGSCTPVIIYSSEKDYLETYKNFLFPSFYAICHNYDSFPLFVEGSEVAKLYEKITAIGQELLNASNFVIDHAHNCKELHSSLHKYGNIMKTAG